MRRETRIRMQIDQALGRQGKRLIPTYEVTLINTALAMTAQGLGLAILPTTTTCGLGTNDGLTNREHIIALEPLDNGLMGTLLRYPYEVRDEKEYFDEIQDVKVTKDIRADRST
jgi:hypothetical protein